jgi:N-acetylglucosaminyldiphosphoundecaprenol N-acetyl-beta-D-mannosaminyltransferase
LLEKLRPGIDRPYFVASSLDAAQALRDQLVARGFDPAAIGTESPPFGFERDEAFGAAMAARIRELGTTHLFMGVGAPKSEIWVARHFALMPAAHIFCVGAALDFSSQKKARARVDAQAQPGMGASHVERTAPPFAALCWGRLAAGHDHRRSQA